jgi:hypothetical protein
MKLQWLGALGLAGAFALTFAACGSDEQLGLSGTTSGTPTTTGTTSSGTGGDGTGGTGGDGTGGIGGDGTGGDAVGGSGGIGGSGSNVGGTGGGIGGSGGNGVGGQGGNGTGGSNACIGCADVVGNNGDPALICTMNGPPSSEDLLNALGTCVCVDSCANECGASACMGMPPDQACQNCIFGPCGADAQACLNDTGGPPPPPPPCIECDAALNGGDPADLCTMNGPPSSEALFDTFIQCACVDVCANECASACMGGAPDAACQTCIGQGCNTEFMECLNDTGGPPPPPPPCDTCGVALQANDPSNLCTMNGPPSSEDIFTDLFTCACGASCVNECATACNGGAVDGACQNCAFANCNAEVNACLGDM